MTCQMFSMTAAEFSLYLGVIIVVSMLGLAFWVWTQIRDLQLSFKTLDMTTNKLTNRIRDNGTSAVTGPPTQVDAIAPQTEQVNSPENDTDDIANEFNNVKDIEDAEVAEDAEDAEVDTDDVLEVAPADIDGIMNDITEVEAEETTDVIRETPIENAPDYKKMKLGDLRRIAEEKKVNGYKHMQKNDLIDALTAL